MILRAMPKSGFIYSSQVKCAKTLSYGINLKARSPGNVDEDMKHW